MISMWKDWLGLLALLISLGGVLYAWLTRRSKENAASIQRMSEELSAKLTDNEKKLISDDRRIQRLENDVDHLPTKESISELKVALAQVSATVEATNRVITRVEDDLRSMKKA